MAGVDTLKISAELDGPAYSYVPRILGEAVDQGSHGVVWWRAFEHPVVGRCVLKWATPAYGHMVWEQSVPKLLHQTAPATGKDCCDVMDAFIEPFGGRVQRVRFTRVDVCEDVSDPHGRLIKAAVGWNPHARSRYIQAVYNDDETVFLRNKSRAVRVYNKGLESGDPSFTGVTRVEYQARKRWAEKLGLDVYSPFWQANVDEAIRPLVEDLMGRSGSNAENAVGR